MTAWPNPLHPRCTLPADCMNDFGMTLELLSPLVPGAFLPLACAGSLARAVTGVAGGATRFALTQHFALRRNAADVAAKEGSQVSGLAAASLVGPPPALSARSSLSLSSRRTAAATLLPAGDGRHPGGHGARHGANSGRRRLAARHLDRLLPANRAARVGQRARHASAAHRVAQRRAPGAPLGALPLHGSCPCATRGGLSIGRGSQPPTRLHAALHHLLAGTSADSRASGCAREPGSAAVSAPGSAPGAEWQP